MSLFPTRRHWKNVLFQRAAPVFEDLLQNCQGYERVDMMGKVMKSSIQEVKLGKEKSLIWLKDSTNNELQVTLWGKRFCEIGKTLNTGDVLQVDNAIMLKQKGQFSGSLCWAFLRQWKACVCRSAREPRLCHFAAIHENNQPGLGLCEFEGPRFCFNKNPSNLYWWFLLGIVHGLKQKSFVMTGRRCGKQGTSYNEQVIPPFLYWLVVSNIF